jgi:flavodoxin/nitroimidazol reductase NimA-like FMN-containing flavoprotein (pyridoxamine 5'-phosphate oxidase superfamily)
MAMPRTMVIYDSVYGSTEIVAVNLSRVLGPAKLYKVSGPEISFYDYDFYVIGSPVYRGQTLPAVSSFVEQNLQWLEQRPVAFFSTGLQPHGAESCWQAFTGKLQRVVDVRALVGRLAPERLTPQDSADLDLFCRETGRALQSVDLDLQAVSSYALQLKEIKETLVPKQPEAELKRRIDTFLASHNTCTLVTGYQDRLRATPLEYSSRGEFIYLISEGGEKFAYLMLNPQVAVAIYDSYEGMDKLAGLQIQGSAQIVPAGSDEYREMLRRKRIGPKKLARMGFDLHLVKVKIEKAEFLAADYIRHGYGPRQVWYPDV